MKTYQGSKHVIWAPTSHLFPPSSLLVTLCYCLHLCHHFLVVVVIVVGVAVQGGGGSGSGSCSEQSMLTC
jgi:hypothetical protein